MKASHDLATREGIEAFVTAFVFDQARSIFDTHGRVPMLAHLVCTRGSDDGSFVVTPGGIGIITCVVDQLSNGAAKDEAVAVIRDRVRQFEAIGVVMVNECWMVRGGSGTARADLVISRTKGLEFHPRRVEAVFVTCEHIRMSASWSGVISRDAAGDGTVGAFVKEAASVDGGRFADLLQRERFS